jgi:hypothetical protein
VPGSLIVLLKIGTLNPRVSACGLNLEAIFRSWIYGFLILLIPAICGSATTFKPDLVTANSGASWPSTVQIDESVQTSPISIDSHFKILYFKALNNKPVLMPPLILSNMDIAFEKIQTITNYQSPFTTSITCCIPLDEELDRMINLSNKYSLDSRAQEIPDPDLLFEIGFIQGAQKKTYSLNAKPLFALLDQILAFVKSKRTRGLLMSYKARYGGFLTHKAKIEMFKDNWEWILDHQLPPGSSPSGVIDFLEKRRFLHESYAPETKHLSSILKSRYPNYFTENAPITFYFDGLGRLKKYYLGEIDIEP